MATLIFLLFFPPAFIIHSLSASHNYSVAGIRPAHLPGCALCVTVYFTGGDVGCTCVASYLLRWLKIMGPRSDLFAREKKLEVSKSAVDETYPFIFAIF